MYIETRHADLFTKLESRTQIYGYFWTTKGTYFQKAALEETKLTKKYYYVVNTALDIN